MTGCRLETEVFTLPYAGQHIVYAPLRQAALLVNDTALDLISDIQDGLGVTETPENVEMLALLHDLGVASLDEVRVEDEPVDIALAGPQPYRPTSCTVFLTSECNLRCVYCYASGGDSPRTLDPAIAHAAIDLVIANAAQDGAEEVLVAFHGGGEPTVASDALIGCVQRAQAGAEREGLHLVTALATNGVMKRAMAEFVAQNFDSVMVSIDGPPEVQDRLRPRASGAGSFDAVDRTLRRLSSGRCQVGARLTVTDDSVDHLVSGVRYLLDSGAVTTIHIEPLFMCGRSLTSNVRPPSPERFVELFRLCRSIAAVQDVEVIYSGARQDTLTTSFCEVSRPSFNITPDGDVTACYEVSSRDDPRAERFLFGRFDADEQRFVFDDERIASLRGLTVAAAVRCDKCFCKYHCAGDCASKRLYPGADETLLQRCTITRRLTQDRVEESLMGTGSRVLIETMQDGNDPRGLTIRGEEEGS